MGFANFELQAYCYSSVTLKNTFWGKKGKTSGRRSASGSTFGVPGDRYLAHHTTCGIFWLDLDEEGGAVFVCVPKDGSDFDSIGH